MSRLVLIPGLAGDAVMWQAQLPALAARGAAVTDVHMRYGSIPDMAAALLAEQEGDLILCGASMGGMVAMEAARQAPERIAGLALLGTTARPESEEMRTLRENAIELFAQGRAAEVIEANVGFAFHADQAGDAALVAAYLEFVMRAGAGQLIRQNRAVIARPDARLHLPLLRCPTLVMCGDSDQLTPPENSEEIARLVPGARLVTLARCGHMLTMEKPGMVNARLLEWLEAIPDRGCAPSPSTSAAR
ncbi:alpha/beta fold hydrolase [Caenimonas soli]|uniref:alpha/beta fold hydrolase n=1 Tax=Caenimonas soli TaxID=2735555 RepID=UPI0015532290|nr:alpha/beta hydrolase [Caenimonas soli]NPC57648.1 alpha/beta hydrolase [Caenimonas soli]